MTLTETNFNFPGQTAVYHGKVRDVYTIDNNLLVMVATDRISAFDVILPKGIPFNVVMRDIARMEEVREVYESNASSASLKKTARSQM